MITIQTKHSSNRDFDHGDKFKHTVRAISFKNCGKSISAGMLMSEVGIAVDAKSHLVKRALEALAAFHQAGFYHGDPRHENLLDCEGTLKWCDLQITGSEGSSLHLCHNIMVLLRSFGVQGCGSVT
jgi:tRNA A-37 threonylcarbamoyl transferase component Bud32